MNPGLRWRDVQDIFVHTAVPTPLAQNGDPTDDGDGNGFNGAVPGLRFSHRYGFGRVDADAAVAEAQNRIGQTLPGFSRICAALPVAPGGETIPENSGNLRYDIPMSAAINALEHVQLQLQINHPHRGDLVVRLTSPAGIQSILARRHTENTPCTPPNCTYQWTYTSVRHWGESSVGNWIITVMDDLGTNSSNGTLLSGQLILYGVSTSLPLFGDLNNDGVVNVQDVTIMGQCWTGPGGPLTPGCEPADSDCDGDVDLVDLGNLLSNLKL